MCASPSRFHEAGFGRVEIFGGIDGRPYDENAERLVLRAVREV